MTFKELQLWTEGESHSKVFLMPFCWNDLFGYYDEGSGNTMIAFDFVYDTHYTNNEKAKELKQKYRKLEAELAQNAKGGRRPPTPEEKQRLTIAKQQVAKKNIMLGEILQIMSTIYTFDIPTFAVDGKGNLLINLAFAKTLTDRQLEAVLAHEAYHILQRHHERFREHAPFKYVNIATDAFINDDLAKDNFDVLSIGGVSPKHGVLTLFFLFVEVNDPDPSIAKPQLYCHTTKLKEKNWETLFQELNDVVNNVKTLRPMFSVGDIITNTVTKKSYIITYVYNYAGTEYKSVEITSEEVARLRNVPIDKRLEEFNAQ